MLAWTLKPIRLKKGAKLIDYRSQTSIARLTLEILNRMPIVKQIDSLKLIERTIQTLKPAMQLRHEKLKLIRLLRQKLELTNLIDWQKRMLGSTTQTGSLKLKLELVIQTDLQKLKLGLVTQIELQKSKLVLRILIDLPKSKLEPRILIDSLKRIQTAF